MHSTRPAIRIGNSLHCLWNERLVTEVLPRVSAVLLPPAEVRSVLGLIMSMMFSAGIEPFVVQTAAAMPKLQHHYPVEAGHDNITAEFMFSNSGNLAPPRSIASWGLPDASERIPQHCELDQVQIVHRHGQRYPTVGTSTEALGRKIRDAGKDFDAQGPMAFLKTWSYPLGSEILTPAGRLQLFQLGAAMRLKYGGLLERMRSLSHKPVFRTTSQDRMLHSALNFAAGFFGIPHESQYHQMVTIEDASAGVNNTLIAQQNCPNEGRAVNMVGRTKAKEWTDQKFARTAERLQQTVRALPWSLRCH